MLVSPVGCFNYGFACLFADLLRHLVYAFLEKACGIAPFRHLLKPVRNKNLQLGEKQDRVGYIVFAPTCVSTFVACRSQWVGFD